MYKHILIPTEGSELSEKAIRHGIALAKALNAKVTGVTVSAPFHTLAIEPTGIPIDGPEMYQRRCADIAKEHLETVRSNAASSGVACETIHVEHDHIYDAIINAAKNRGCDAIVMASHGRRGISAMLLGSETVKVLTHSTIPVIVCR